MLWPMFPGQWVDWSPVSFVHSFRKTCRPLCRRQKQSWRKRQLATSRTSRRLKNLSIAFGNWPNRYGEYFVARAPRYCEVPHSFSAVIIDVLHGCKCSRHFNDLEWFNWQFLKVEILWKFAYGELFRILGNLVQSYLSGSQHIQGMWADLI